MNPHSDESPIPSERPLPEGSVLCLDIDGVCAPIGQNLRFHCHAPHPGFVVLPRQPVVQVHPALPKWARELADAFDHVAWISSWNTRCADFAVDAGISFAASWPYLPGAGSIGGERLHEGRTPLPWAKLDAVLHWIRPDQPVALVDDDLDTKQFPYGVEENVRRSIESIRSRQGPILLVAPAKEIGLTREAVDLLCAFARNPRSRRLHEHTVHRLNQGRWIQWPWPLPSGQENPVAFFPEDEKTWEAERKEQLRERRLEVMGRKLHIEGLAWSDN